MGYGPWATTREVWDIQILFGPLVGLDKTLIRTMNPGQSPDSLTERCGHRLVRSGHRPSLEFSTELYVGFCVTVWVLPSTCIIFYDDVLSLFESIYANVIIV
jgi:hypothetical protein